MILKHSIFCIKIEFKIKILFLIPLYGGYVLLAINLLANLNV